jgi:hypothetical protein
MAQNNLAVSAPVEGGCPQPAAGELVNAASVFDLLNVHCFAFSSLAGLGFSPTK